MPLSIQCPLWQSIDLSLLFSPEFVEGTNSIHNVNAYACEQTELIFHKNFPVLKERIFQLDR